MTVRKIVQVSGKEGLDYIAYVSTDKSRHFLLSIRSEDGELNWMEEIYLKVEVPVVYLEALPDMKTIYLVIADKNGKTDPIIHKFNFEGRMTDSGEIRYPKRNFTVRAVDTYGDRIALACNFTDSSSAFILDLDSRLNPVKNEMLPGMDCELYDIKFYKGYNYLVTGKNYKSDRLFIMQVGPGTAFYTRYEMTDANAESAALSVTGDDFYLVREEKGNGSVYYFNQDFHNVWAKQIVLSGNNQNGISRITNMGNAVTFTGLDDQNGYFVAGMNRDLDSTLTALLPSADLLAERGEISRGEAIVENARTPETAPLQVLHLDITAAPRAILSHRLTFLVSSIFTGRLEFVYSEQFEEILPSQGTDTPIFMVGKHNDRGLIIKTGPDGRIMWQHLYTIRSATSPLMIHKITQVSGNSGSYQYVVRMSSEDNRHYLMCISSLNGSMIWVKEFEIDPSQDTFFLERVQGENAFYLVCTGPRYKTFINKFSSTGNLLLSKTLTLGALSVQIKAVKSYSQGLLLACMNYDMSFGNFILDLDNNLRGNHASSIVERHKWDLLDVKYYQGRYLVLGRNLSNGLLCITSLSRNDGWYDYYEIPGTVSSTGSLCLLENDFYITQYTDGNGIVHRFGSNFQGIWSKEIVVAESHRNRIMFLKQLNRRLTFTGYEDNVGSFMGNTNENLSSCRTEVLGVPRLSGDRCYIKRMQIEIYEAGLNLSIPDIRYSIVTGRTANLCAGYGPGTTQLSDKFALQTAGSKETTDGSAKGIHVRWAFRGILGDKHLPKGDYAITRHNFNKENDYVKLYRTAYERVPYLLDFAAGPNGVEDATATWIYGRYRVDFCVYFLDIARYNTIRDTIDPLARPMEFMEAYGDSPIEVESRNGLFFAVDLNVSNYNTTSYLKTETLSVERDGLTAPRYTNSRKTYTGSSVSNIHIIVENGKSIRFAASSCRITGVTFEFYSHFLARVNDDFGWDDLGEYALSLNDDEVLQRLEPEDGLIHGKWQRYNDNSCVNITNYKDKWNGPLIGENDRNIRTVVSKFIDLSNEIDNPRANESIFLGPEGETPQSPDDMMDVSLLDFLNAGANDFHVARMLGLGTIDHDERVFDGKYIYVAQYFTHVDLEDGEGERTMEHLAMSLPTSIYDERLPLPVTLDRIAPGIVNEPNNQGAPSNVTDADGYTRDGRYRYVTLIAEPEMEDEINQPFYASSREFNYSEFTMPIYGGVEYRKESDRDWIKPELSNDPYYQNFVLPGQPEHNETIPLLVSEDTGVLYIHKQRHSGLQFYSSYGINIFSRATSSPVTLSILTDLQPANTLKPPVNIKAHLVREERPLLLTSQLDQNRYAQLSTASDKTLIRLTFDYHTHHELTTYMVEDIYEGMTTAQLENNNSTAYPNDMEIYAEEIEIFFRNRVPRSVSGKATLIQDDFGNPLLSIVRTQPYHVASTGEDLVPAIPADLAANYTGGVFMMGDERYIIHSIIPGNTNPTIRVYKREISDTLVMSDIPSPDADNLQAPQITDDGLFTVMENMQNTDVWGDYNPNNLKVKIGRNWTVKREIFEEFNENEQRNKRYLEKSRGFWQDAVIEPIEEPVDRDDNNNLIYGYQGLYKVTFNGFTLPQHPQYNSDGISVEWYNGIVRLKRKPAYMDNGERTRFEVVKMESHASALVLYIQDPLFEGVDTPNAIQRGTQSVNYYPGYKVYLYADAAAHLTEEHILPVEEEVKYSIFGLRSHDLDYPTYYSRMSEPVLMFAQKLEEPQRPELPQGGKYATRPDFFGKSTYTFTTRFTHRPTNVLFYRSNDELFLNALYKKDTLSAIRYSLEPLGGNDEEYLVNRWENFLDFPQLAIDGNYKIYPPANVSPDGYRFPLPDHPAFISAINDFVRWYNSEYNLHINTINTISSLNQVIIPASSGHAVRRVVDFIEQVIFNSFVPLTELPITYQYIKPNALHPGDYNPLPRKQNIKDRNGYMLQPTDPEFDVAPMAKVTDSNVSSPSVLFTDFTLDGTSKNIYFYTVKEMSNQMRMGEFSPVLGPIKLVNTNAPEAPAVKNVMPVLGNVETLPAIKFEINAYPENQFIRKITIYRAHNLLDAQSVRTMERVEVIDLEEAGILNDNVWTFYDHFRGMAEVPYGDSLYYRITVSRKVEYNEENTGTITEYAPSQPSKIIATFIVDTSVPESPVLDYTADELSEENELYNVVLSWQKTVYNGTYYLYKMNSQGNWILIKELTSNENDISVPLLETEWGTGRLSLTDENGDSLYHHFKVLVKNTSGIMSIRENILTIGNEIEDDQNPGPDPEPRNEIWNRADLLAFRELVNGGIDERAGEIWYLMDDIDLTGITNLSIGGSDGFWGTLEGNFHRLYNITMRDSSIFSALHADGVIRNLLVTDADITTGLATANLSILVNFVRGLVENCFVQGTIRTGSDSLASGKGGIASMNSATGKILNCFVNVSITGRHRIGGVTGNNGGIVEKCYTTGQLNCSDLINGGVVAQQGNTGIVKDCVNIIPAITGLNPGAMMGTNRVYSYEMRSENNYSLSNTTINGNAITGGTASNRHGQNVTDAQLKTRAFWESAGYDFVNIWKMSSITGPYRGYPIFIGMEE